VFVVFLVATSGTLNVVVGFQGQTKPQSAAKPAAKNKFRLRVTKGYVTGVSLKAEKAKLSEIAVDLSKRLGARVILGPGMTKEAITVEFLDLPLEMAMRLLAPSVFIDYEIRANAQPKPLAVFLMGQGDSDPAKDAVVQGSSQAILIEGNTEDTPEQAEEPDDDPLQVELDDNSLTVKSRKQPLAAVLLMIADVLGVPAEIKYDSSDLVDTVIKDTPFEDAITRLSPNIRLYVRADVTRSQRLPLRLTLVPPVANDGQ